MRTKTRSTYLDAAKAILIICVLLGHLGSDASGNSGILRALEFFIYIFHMPVFIFISGYLTKRGTDSPPPEILT